MLSLFAASLGPSTVQQHARLSRVRFTANASNTPDPSKSSDDVFQRSSELPAIVGNTAAASSPIPPLAKTDALKRFAVIGDFGVGHHSQYLEQNGTSGEDAVVHQMIKTFEKKPFASILTMGDNVYPYGEKRYFDEDIRKPFQAFRDQSVRFYPVLGNHDVRDGSQGGEQLKYWGTPRYYQTHIGNVDVFGIDTTLFFPGFIYTYPHNPQQARQAAARQVAWLDKALKNSTAKYKIVYGHYPLHSLAEQVPSLDHGTSQVLRDTLEPILKRNGVDAYLAGHHHAYERTDINTTEVPDFVSGAGGALLNSKQLSQMDPSAMKAPLKIFIPQRHFMLFEDTPAGLSFDAISETGEVLDHGIIKPKPERIASEKSKAVTQFKEERR